MFKRGRPLRPTASNNYCISVNANRAPSPASVELLWLGVFAIATVRATSIIVSEGDLWGVLDRVRKALLIWWDEEEAVYHYEPRSPHPRLAQLLTCFDCCSVWIATVLILLNRVHSSSARLLALPLAVSQLALWARDIADDTGIDADSDTA